MCEGYGLWVDSDSLDTPFQDNAHWTVAHFGIHWQICWKPQERSEAYLWDSSVEHTERRKKYQLSISIYLGKIHLVKLSWKKNKLWRTSCSTLRPVLQDKWTLIFFASKNHAATCQTLGTVYQTTTAGSLEISQTTFLYVQLDKCNSPSPTFSVRLRI